VDFSRGALSSVLKRAEITAGAVHQSKRENFRLPAEQTGKMFRAAKSLSGKKLNRIIMPAWPGNGKKVFFVRRNRCMADLLWGDLQFLHTGRIGSKDYLFGQFSLKRFVRNVVGPGAEPWLKKPVSTLILDCLVNGFLSSTKNRSVDVDFFFPAASFSRFPSETDVCALIFPWCHLACHMTRIYAHNPKTPTALMAS